MKPRVFWLTTSTNNTLTVMGSLEFLECAELDIFRYDLKWQQNVNLAVQSDPSVKDQLQAGTFHLPPARAQMDMEILKKAKDYKPDLIIYTSAWEGDFVPKIETLGELNSIAPLIHFCFDGSDPPWHSQMFNFESRGVFRLTVNIDGNHNWPGGRRWEGNWRINGLTLLTPCDPRSFHGVQVPFNERPYPIGYAGNAGGWIRGWLVNQLQSRHGHIFAYRPRSDHPQDYYHYTTFLRHAKVVISIPFTGSNATKHVKGRVVEAGWAGACLLEWRNEATRDWFIPRYEFEEYTSVDECLAMVEWLAKEPKRVEEMATNLRYKVENEHSPKAIWSQIFEKVGLEI